MKVYLDDERLTPNGWTRVYWTEEAIGLLKTNKVTDISLDHDLGDDNKGTEYDVLLWIEQAVIQTIFSPSNILIHSANASARIRMELAIRSIRKHSQQENL